MRYLIAKTACETKDNKFGNIVDISTRYLTYYCSNCGAELEGIFQCVYPGTRRSIIRDYYNNRERYSNNEDKCREIDARISQLEKELSACEDSVANAEKAYEEAQKLSNCPICSKPLFKKKGYYMPNPLNKGMDKEGFFKLEKEGERPIEYSPRTADEMFEKMALIREYEESTQMHQQTDSYIQLCDCYIASVPDAESISTSADQLKKYLSHLIHLENNIYSLSKQLSALYYKRLLNDRTVIMGNYLPQLQLKAKTDALQATYNQTLTALKEAEEFQPKVSVDYPNKPSEPVYAIPGLFNKKKIQEENDALRAAYKEKLAAYNEEVRHCDEEKASKIAAIRAEMLETAKKNRDEAKALLDIAQQNKDKDLLELEWLTYPSKSIKDILDKEIAQTEDLLKKTFKARNELYSYNVIFDKYRDVVALSSFYEYLMAGRCSSLEGADGAYNLYESEIRANNIIDKLDTVITSLEDIKQNQYMIYQEMQNIHKSLDNLSSTMDKALTTIGDIKTNTDSLNEHMEHIAKNSDVIAHNTAVSAYYSKVNAELTNALGYMAAFK